MPAENSLAVCVQLEHAPLHAGQQELLVAMQSVCCLPTSLGSRDKVERCSFANEMCFTVSELTSC